MLKSISKKVKGALNNQRGDIASYIVFFGLVLLATIALKPTVDSTYSETGTSTKTFITSKISGVLK